MSDSRYILRKTLKEAGLGEVISHRGSYYNSEQVLNFWKHQKKKIEELEKRIKELESNACDMCMANHPCSECDIASDEMIDEMSAVREEIEHEE